MTRAVAGMALAAWLCSLAHAQSGGDAKAAGGKLEFEVASIKPSEPPSGRGMIRVGGKGGPGSDDPGRVTYSFTRIRDLMVDAYGVKHYQISGGPNWLDSERFDIEARVPEGATKEQVKVMLQNLLAERFKLTLHRETKVLPIYALVVAGSKGARLKESTASNAPPAPNSQPNDAGRGEGGSPPPLPPGFEKGGIKIGADGCPEAPPMVSGRPGNFMLMTPSGACMISNGQTMEGLATQLSNQFDRPVIDQTGLKGKYDFRLRFDPSSMPMVGGRGGGIQIRDGGPRLGPGPAGDPSDRVVPEGDQPPGIFNAIEDQLGLKLQAKKGPVDLLVIDHVEKTPTEN